MKPHIYGKRSFRHSSSVGRHPAATECRPMSDVTSDLTVEVGGASFALHKFPLVSRSGRIRKMLADAGKEPKISRMNLSDIPGGCEAFELAAKVCYGVPVDVSLSNVAVLNSVAVFLEMTEDLSEGNLETRTETFLNDVVFPDISNSISVLHRCEPLLPFPDAGTGLVGRLVTSIANNVCKEQLTSGLSKLDDHHRTLPFLPPNPNVVDEETLADSWGNALAVLGVDFFKRVVLALRGKGLNQEIITKIMINYARNSLLRVDDPRSGHTADTEAAEKKQRKIVEVITNLLPKMSRKGTTTVPVAFLSSLFKTAMAVSASASCRSDLERRIGLQLDEAILEDILVPSSPSPNPSGNNDDSDHNNNNNDEPLFDTDCVSRIFSFFLNLNQDEDEKDEDDLVGDEGGMVYDMDSPGSPKQSTIIKASKLMDIFLAEVALDPNMAHSKFIALAELLPDHARPASDGLYRAVDIFLKVHPDMSDSEKHRLCKTIDCQKMTQEACSHAAQNDRLPVQMAVQVLYFEHIRLRNAMAGSGGGGGYTHHHHSYKHQAFLGPMRSGSAAGSACISPRDNYASVRRENRELKLEVARMRMRLTDLEKDHVSMKEELVRPHRAAANNFLKSFTKKLCKINSLFRGKGGGSSEGRCRFQKRRRHSVS
ncbi:unnamed protein product [Cuscuta campestris]|uniref:NPH3 domain-containing protein n=1 Tax=Cuscuta campestris TaxID=132261 RepID=A0A484K9Q9_9ASTE|nr:unnamed protein product [Cuscuta campestris]